MHMASNRPASDGSSRYRASRGAVEAAWMIHQRVDTERAVEQWRQYVLYPCVVQQRGSKPVMAEVSACATAEDEFISHDNRWVALLPSPGQQKALLCGYQLALDA